MPKTMMKERMAVLAAMANSASAMRGSMDLSSHHSASESVDDH
jgi:hypothetical protein